MSAHSGLWRATVRTILLLCLVILAGCSETPTQPIPPSGPPSLGPTMLGLMVALPGDGIRDLGTLGGPYSVAHGIDQAGRVAGYSALPDGHTEAFLWQTGGGMTSLSPATGASVAYAIADDGRVVGYRVDGVRFLAFRWEPGVGMTDLGTLGGLYTMALGLNDVGQVVGYASLPNGEARAFIWELGFGLTDLGTLGGTLSYAQGVNDAGQVVGTSTLPDGHHRAFIWEDGGGMKDLGTFGGPESFAMGINNAGQVVGYSTLANGLYHAFIWEVGSGMRDLGTLGGSQSYANAVNDQGQVVGYSHPPEGQYHAFLWRADAGMIDLGTLGAAGDSYSYALAVNAQGQVVGTSDNRAVFWDAAAANHSPVANAGGPYEFLEGTTSVLDALASTDQDGDIDTYTWDLDGDGTFDDGEGSLHRVTYPDDGEYVVAVKVADSHGAFDTNQATVSVRNVPPSVSTLPDRMLLEGEVYSEGGSFTDPGVEDTWTGTVSYSVGETVPLVLQDQTFALSRRYLEGGIFSIRVTIVDDDGGEGTTVATVTVVTLGQAIDDLLTQINQLEATGAVSHGHSTDLRAHLMQAGKAIDEMDYKKATLKLEALKQRIAQMLRTGALSADFAEDLMDSADRLITAIGAQG